MKATIKIVLVVIATLCISCTSNEFIVDENGCVVGKDKPIRYLEIQSEDGELYYTIENKNSSITSICLDNIPMEYSINKYENINGFINYKKVKSVILEKNKYYNFKMLGGDAGAYNLNVYIDAEGNYIIR